MNQQVTQLLHQVAARQRLASLGHWFYVFTLWLAGAYAVVLVVTRVSSLVPDWYSPPTLLVIIVLAMVLAIILHRRPSQAETARMVDQRTGAKDVFLTAAMIDNAPGEYKPLVLEEAARRAASIHPQTVVPFNFWPRAGTVAAILAALFLAIFVFPHFDPFGKQKERAKEAEKRQLLDQSIKEVSLRASVLANQPLDAERSQAVEQALKDVKQTFNQMKPHDPAGNLRQLNEQQQQVGDMWKKAAEEQLKDSLEQSPLDQRFGGDQDQKTKKWEEELKQGKTDSMQKEAEDLKNLAQQMQNETDPAKKAQQQQELQKRLQDLSDFAQSHANKESLKQALSNAQQQANAAGNPQVSSKALSGVSQSMALTQAELKSMAQSMRDLKSLQQALDAIQAAKQANASGKPMNGQTNSPEMTMDDYKKFFNSMCRGSPFGQPKWTNSGPNNGGLGLGQRPRGASTDKDQFKSEMDNSQLTAGKTLLEWKDKGMYENGQASKNYVQSVKTLKEGVSEAILKEEIPPGYHEEIRKYFDSMGPAKGKAGAGAGTDSAAPTEGATEGTAKGKPESGAAPDSAAPPESTPDAQNASAASQPSSP